MKTTSLTALATLVAPISWGTTYVTVAELLPAGRPLSVAAMRVLPAALVLLAVAFIRSGWRPTGVEWIRTAALAACNFAAFFPLLIVAIGRLPGGVAAALGGLQPLLVVLLSRLIAGTRPRRRDVVVGLVAVLGVGLIVLRPGAGIDGLGVLAAVGANVSFAAGAVFTRLFPAPAHRLAATGWQLLLAGVFLVPLALLVEGGPPAPSASNVVGVLHLSLVGTALAFVLWFDGIRRLPPVAPPLLGLAAPVTGAVLGWVVRDESLSPIQLVGFVVTLSAIAYGATVGHRAGQPATDPVRWPGRPHPRAQVIGTDDPQGTWCTVDACRSTEPTGHLATAERSSAPVGARSSSTARTTSVVTTAC